MINNFNQCKVCGGLFNSGHYCTGIPTPYQQPITTWPYRPQTQPFETGSISVDKTSSIQDKLDQIIKLLEDIKNK